MKSINLTLGQILTSPSQYVIPAFQRYYRWDQPQWEKLWADLADLQQPGKTGLHFMGFLVLIPELVMPGKIGKYHLIDGQQRLTTLSLLLCALRDASKLAGLDGLAQEISLTTLEHQFNKGTDRFRVFPKLRDRDQYIACLGGEPPTEGRLGSAIRYFSGRLTTIPGAGTEDGLRAFFALLTQRLEFIYAQLEGENPFNIFKSLNSTGVPLGQADLIRNFIFMQVPVEDLDEFEGSLWKPTECRFENSEGNIDELAFSSFFRDYLMRNGEYVPPGDTFESFQRHFASTDFDPKQVAADLKQASDWYEILRGNRTDPSPAVESALDTLRQLESSTTYALLLNLYQRRYRGQLTESELAEILRLLAGFILRRLVCGENSRGYARMFIQAISAVGDQTEVRLREFLEARGFPDTPRFVESFARFNLYGSRYRKVVLEALERAPEHKEPVVLTNAQIEHIMPQTLTDVWRTTLGPDAEQIHANWLHTPGNLTLTGYNPELFNRPFSEKRKEYHDSNIMMTRQIAEFETWGEANIRQRGESMAQVAARIWPGPSSLAASATIGGKENDSRFEIRRRYWTGFRDHVHAAGGTLEPKDPNTSNALRCGMIGTGVALYSYFSLRNKRISVGTQFYGKRAKALFQTLHERREELEAEIGAKLVWWVPAKDSHYREVLLRNPVNPTDESLWPHYHDWMRRSLETLERVLGPRVAKGLAAKPENSAGATSETLALYVEYWSALRQRLVQNQSPVKTHKPRQQHWVTASIGRSGMNLAAVASAMKREIRTEVALGGPLAKPCFYLLRQDRAAIEAELGMNLEWRELPGGKDSYIVIRRPDTDPSCRAEWPEQHAWFQEKLEAFSKVFGPRVKELNPESYAPDSTPP